MSELAPNSPSGLTSAQAAERVERGESNAYQSRVGRTYWEIVRDNLLNLFNIVLGVLLIAVLLFHDYSTVIFAGFSVVTNSFLGMIQEIFAKRKLDALAALSLSDVRVWRDGKLTTISIRAIVKDDVIPLEPGDKIVVDGKILHSDALEIDELQLTGESDAVMKNEGDPVYSGSFCIAGSGVMVATTVGKAEHDQPAFRCRQAVQARPDADAAAHLPDRPAFGRDHGGLHADDLHRRAICSTTRSSR